MTQIFESYDWITLPIFLGTLTFQQTQNVHCIDTRRTFFLQRETFQNFGALFLLSINIFLYISLSTIQLDLNTK